MSPVVSLPSFPALVYYLFCKQRPEAFADKMEHHKQRRLHNKWCLAVQQMWLPNVEIDFQLYASALRPIHDHKILASGILKTAKAS